ncbi:MAG TPA: ornithine cyclodeaminase family protein [Sphingomicrobium sp.]|nr:ornithine cyclodeaminase family protein [Sphingomicrobium sp.]
MNAGGAAFYGPDEVRDLLDYPGCIDAVRSAMSALSWSKAEQPLRTIIPLGPGELFGLMPGTYALRGLFGAKLVSVFNDPDRPGHLTHRGVVVLFDRADGGIRCIADAGAVTDIRTACASAAATDAMARRDSRVLAIFGTGAQARSHIRALLHVRPIGRIVIWGRSARRARELEEWAARETGLEAFSTTDGKAAAADADIICTVTAAAEPILLGDWVSPGTHVNLVGSSHLGPTETDNSLVARSRYVADSRASALAAAAEFAAAKAAGIVDDSHIAGEIGDVLLDRIPGRTDAGEVTLYKSLGHVMQDLASAAYVDERARGRNTS